MKLIGCPCLYLIRGVLLPCRVLSDPQVLLVQGALQTLMLKSDPTRLVVVRHMAGAIHTSFQNVASTSGDGSPDSLSASAKQDKLLSDIAAIQQTVSISGEPVLSTAVWQCLVPIIDQKGDAAICMKHLTAQSCLL